MTLDSFLEMQTLPNAGDMMALCDVLNIVITDKPSLRHPHDLKTEALAIAQILRREPWRTQVMQAKSPKELPTTKAPTPEDPKSTIRCSQCSRPMDFYRICEHCGVRQCLCGMKTASTFDEWCSICVHRKW